MMHLRIILDAGLTPEVSMRTTVTIDDALYEQALQAAGGLGRLATGNDGRAAPP